MTRLQLIPIDKAVAAPEWSISSWFNIREAPRLADLRGRVVVVHAFQMLCPGCVSHGIPQAQRIREVFKSTEVAVIGLHSVFEHHDAMRPVSLEAFLHEYRVTFPVGVDVAGDGTPIPKTMGAYHMRGTPTLLVIDSVGRLRLHTFGRPEDLAVGAAIASLVAEGAGSAVPSPAGRDGSEPSASPDCDEDGCKV